MFNISLLADIEEEEVVDQAAAEDQEQEELVDIEDAIVDEAGKEEVAEEQPAAEVKEGSKAEEAKVEPAAEPAQEEAPAEVKEEAPKAEEAAPAEVPAKDTKPTEEEITEDAKVEVAEAEEGGDIEVKDTEVLAESQVLSAQFDELLTMQRHVAKFGVDRTFLALFNKGGRLGRALGVNIPACESVDAVGYPTSALSMACLEAFGHKEKGVVAKIVDFIVALVKKIKNLAARFWTWFVSLFSNQASKWNKLKLASKNRVSIKTDKTVEVNAAGVSINPDLKSKLLTQPFLNIMKSFQLKELTDARNNTKWANGDNASQVEKAITEVASAFDKVTNVRAKDAIGALKTLAKRIEGAFSECDTAKKILAELNGKIKSAEDMVAKSKNSVERFIGFGGKKTDDAYTNWDLKDRHETNVSGKITFGSGHEAVAAAKNALIDLKVRQSYVQKVVSTYARYIKIMLRSYGNILFTLTAAKQ